VLATAGDKKRALIKVAIFAAVTCVILVCMLDQVKVMLERMTEDNGFERAVDNFTTGRTNICGFGISEIFATPWSFLFGIRAGGLAEGSNAIFDMHNALLQIVFDIGVVGLALLILGFFFAVRGHFRQIRFGNVIAVCGFGLCLLGESLAFEFWVLSVIVFAGIVQRLDSSSKKSEKPLDVCSNFM